MTRLLGLFTRLPRRLGLVLVPGLVPWTVLLFRGSPGFGVEFVLAWGIVTTDPLHAVSLYHYLVVFTASLPGRLLAWPVGVVVYGAGVASVAIGTATGHEDERLTAGIFAVAGLSMLVFAVGIWRRNPEAVLVAPVGTVALWAVGWWLAPR